ncbi:MAG: hypothetical protein HQK54_11195 [Oligoflexales bacterium]|nr:hypothetical protein [Oligoflexales bacterium]
MRPLPSTLPGLAAAENSSLTLRRIRLCLMFFFLMTESALADLAMQHMSHQRHNIPGGRAALLGGAYTAISSDPSGLVYNPAGLTFSQTEVSVNTWIQDDTNFVFKGAINGEDFHESSKTRYASFVGGVLKKNIISLGYAATTLDNRDLNQNDNFSGISDQPGMTSEFKRIHQESNLLDLLGGGIAFKIGPSFSIGSSVFYYTRTIESMDYQLVKNNGGSGNIIESKYKVDNTGIMYLTGIILKTGTLSAGISYRGSSVQKNSTGMVGEIVSFKNAENPTFQSVVTSDNHIYDEYVPPTWQIGMAFIPNPYFLISGDLLYHEGKSMNGQSPDRENTFNYSLGIEGGFTNFRLLIGAFSNNSMFPKLKNGLVNQSPHIDYSGFSGGVSFGTKNQEALIGAVMQTGEGRAQIIINSPDTQKVESKTIIYLGSVRFRL